MTGVETLLVDIGNTHLKWAVLAGERRSETRRVNHQHRSLAEALSECWGGLAAPGCLLAASVGADRVNEAVTAWTTARWSLSPRFVTAEAAALGVSNAYDDPASLGVDRWLALIAVRRQTPLPAIVADCGTAITLDAMNGQGKHLGGLILPGLAMMHRALFGGTSIQSRNLPGPQGRLGRTTAEGIGSGGAQAIAALIDRLVVDIAVPGQAPPALVLTGSDAPRIEPLLRQSGRIEPDLVMQGLHAVAKRLET